MKNDNETKELRIQNLELIPCTWKKKIFNYILYTKILTIQVLCEKFRWNILTLWILGEI